MGKWTAEYEGTAAVDELGEFRLAEHEPAARTAQRLMGCGGDDMRMWDGVVVAGEHLARDETGEVRHVDHEGGADLVGDLSHDSKVHEAWVRAVAGDQNQWPLLVRPPPHVVVVQEKRRRINAVRALAEQFSGDVRAEAVGQVPAGLQ